MDKLHQTLWSCACGWLGYAQALLDGWLCADCGRFSRIRMAVPATRVADTPPLVN